MRSVDLTAVVYDAAGNVTEQRRYAKALSGTVTYSAAGIAGAITSQSLRDDQHDQLSRFVYDSAGRQRYALKTKTTVGSVDSVYVVEQRYDNVGHITDTYRYAKEMALTVGPTPLSVGSVAAIVAANLDGTNDQHDHSDFDGAGRLTLFTDANGKTQSYQYTELGQKKSYTNQNGIAWTYYYDAAGRLSEERSAQTTLYQQAATPGANARLHSPAPCPRVSFMTNSVISSRGTKATRRLRAALLPSHRCA